MNVCNNQLDHTSSARAPGVIHNKHLMFTRKECPYPAAGAQFSGQNLQPAKSLVRKRPSVIAHACPQGSNHNERWLRRCGSTAHRHVYSHKTEATKDNYETRFRRQTNDSLCPPAGSKKQLWYALATG